VEEKDFKRLVLCLQLSTSNIDGEALNAVRSANRILEKNGLRWDEWLPGLKHERKEKTRTSDFYSAWEKARAYNTADDFDRQRREWRDKTRKADSTENPKWVLSKEDADWVKDLCSRALESVVIQGAARRFVGDMAAMISLFPKTTTVSKKQWDWLQSIELTLQRTRKRAG
jgi:hypothetical protein